MLVLLAVGSAGVARAADDTAKFYGQWKTSFPYNGQMVTIISVHDENGYTNYFVTPSGFTPAGSGGFHAANGFWSAAAAAPNNGGTYLFTGKNAVVCTNSMGQTVTWVRDKTPLPKSDGAAPAGDGDAQPAPKPGGKAEVEAPDDPADAEPDPSLPAPTRAAIAAFNRKDYKAAWDNFMIGAQQGDAEAQAGLGSMLFQKINPPGHRVLRASGEVAAAVCQPGQCEGDGLPGTVLLPQWHEYCGRDQSRCESCAGIAGRAGCGGCAVPQGADVD